LENVAEVLKMTYPIELTLSKLASDSRRNVINLNGVEIYPADSNKCNTDHMMAFHRIGFQTKYRLGRRRDKIRSIPINKGKISISDVIWGVETLREAKSENDKVEAERLERERIQKAEQAAEEKKMSDLREEAHLSDSMELGTHWDSDDLYRISFGRLTREQVIKIGKAIYNAGGLG
jgi:hypothetical protein